MEIINYECHNHMLLTLNRLTDRLTAVQYFAPTIGFVFFDTSGPSNKSESIEIQQQINNFTPKYSKNSSVPPLDCG